MSALDPGIEISKQYPAEADVTLRPDEAGAWPPTKLHRELFDDDESVLGERLLEAVRSIGRRAASARNLYRILDDVDALDGGYLDLCVGVVKGRRRDAAELIRATRQLGGQTSHDVRTGFEDILSGDPAVFAAAGSATPTIAISMDGFADVRRDQRENVLALVRAYARGCHVTLVAGPIERVFLWRFHREELPGSVKDDCKPRLGEQANPATVEAVVAEARSALAYDSRPVHILRLLAGEGSEALAYHALAAEMGVGRGTVRNHVTQRLVPNNLVDRFDQHGDAHVSLTHTGKTFLSVLDSEIGRQQSITESVEAGGQAVTDSRVSPPAREGRPRPDGEGEGTDVGASDRHRLPLYHSVGTLSRWHAVGTAAVARENGVALVDRGWDEADDRGEGSWWADRDGGAVTVSAEYANPMQWWVCIARALADGRTFRHVLDEDAFEDTDTDTRLSELFGEHRWLLRDSRCVGYLKDAATAEEFVEALREAEGHLCELTKRWKGGEFDCSPEEFRGIVTREALGLASTIVHLLDLADVDVTIEARIPDYRTWDKSDRRTLARSVARGAAIESRYREFAAYRQLFEGREEKRAATFAPTVDADDPLGECITSFVVTGPGVGDPEKGSDDRGDDLADLIRDEIDGMKRHEDAPDFQIRVPIDERAGQCRTATAEAVQDVCAAKDLSTTRTAISWFDAFVSTPYDAARAAFELGAETKAPGRRVAPHDVRYALSTLPAETLLPGTKPTIKSMFKTLLTTDPGESLSNAEIADRGGPSARSIRRNAEALEAFGIVEHTDAGWSLPETLTATDDCGRFVTDVVSDALATLVPDRYADPDDPIGAALYRPPGQRLPALREIGWLDPWLRLLMQLRDEALTAPDSPTAVPVATFGDPPVQAAVTPSVGVAD